MKNTIRIVILGVVGFALLVYLTLPNKTQNDKSEVKEALTINSLPTYFDVVGNNPYTKFDTLFKIGEEKYMVVLNHDALAVFKELYKKMDKNVVLIANISNTPWIVKQIAVNGELEKMYKNSKNFLINDSDGSFINTLGVTDNKQNKYFIFKLTKDGDIIKVLEGSVKEGALEKGLSNDELEKNLNEIIKNFK